VTTPFLFLQQADSLASAKLRNCTNDQHAFAFITFIVQIGLKKKKEKKKTLINTFNVDVICASYKLLSDFIIFKGEH
jgi:hypothetical protein